MERADGRRRPKTAGEIDEQVRRRRRKARARDAQRRCRERRLTAMERDPAHPAHGTVTGYNSGCRCERCRTCWAEKVGRARKAAYRAAHPPGAGPGTPWRRPPGRKKAE